MYKQISLLTVLLFLTACATTQTGNNGPYRVGPQSSKVATAQDAPNQLVGDGLQKLSVIVPIMDPNLPEDSDDYEKLGIWPELRYAEANRFAHLMKVSLDKTARFDGVRVYPDTNATAGLYVMGKILKSNGEDIDLQITVVDISGRTRMQKTFKNRVKEYDVKDPRQQGKDFYVPFFDAIAAEIAQMQAKIKPQDRANLDVLETVRFGESMSADYFSKYLKVSRAGIVSLAYAPSRDDPMIKNLEAVRIKDQMFIDQLQDDYAGYVNKLDEPYLVWQKQAFELSKEQREASAKAATKAIFGTLAAVAGAVIAANNDSDSTTTEVGSTALILGGAAAVFDSFSDRAEARQNRNALNELGSQLNIELASKNMQLEDEVVELTGTAEEQAATWRAVLREYYLATATPDVNL